jgi:DNA-binding response OmpR family regulator
MKNILVVDDCPELRQQLKLALEEDGYGVLTASAGGQALALLEARPVDLMLVDVGIPDLNGYQLYETVKDSTDPRWVLMPFILMSCRTLASDIRYGKALGADDYLTKPVRVEDLLAVVRGKLRASDRVWALFKQRPAALPDMIRLTLNQHQVCLDCRQHRAWTDGQELKLTAREMFLFEALARQPNEVVRVVDLFRVTNGQAVEVQEAGRLMRPIIHSLRHKLKRELGGLDCIKNVRGRGYLLIVG